MMSLERGSGVVGWPDDGGGRDDGCGGSGVPHRQQKRAFGPEPSGKINTDELAQRGNKLRT